MPVLKIEKHPSTLKATITRPKALNAINFEVMNELEKLLTKIENDSEIRCFILTGEGREAFVSGGDLREFHTIKTAEEARPMAKRMMSILARIEKLPCWTIAAVNGPAYGGGCEMMLAFDFRIASSKATFGFTQGKFYLPPGWGGLTRLVECVGRSTALRWLAEAKIMDAQTALDHKLINRVATPEELNEKSWNWAQQLTKNDRNFIKNLKKGAMRFTQNRWKTIDAELDTFPEFWESDLHHQRVEKFLERKSTN